VRTAHVELRPLGGDSTHVLTSTGEAFRVPVGYRQLRADIDEYCRSGTPARPTAALIEKLAAAGQFGPAAEPAIVFDYPLAAPLAERGTLSAAINRALPPAAAAPDPAARLRVRLAAGFGWPYLRDFGAECDRLGVAGLFAYFLGGSLYYGPVYRPGQRPDVYDYMERRLTAATRAGAISLLMEPARYGSLAVDAGLAGAAVETMLRDLDRFLAGGDDDLRHEEREAGRRGHASHPVLPMPWPPPGPDGPRPPEAVVDRRLGIVTRVEKISYRGELGQQLSTYQSWAAAMDRVYDRDVSPINAGSTASGGTAGYDIAVGESIERYCGNLVQADKLTWGSHETLSRAGRACLRPGLLALFSDEQYADPLFPFAEFTGDLWTGWVPGASLLRPGGEVLLPASAVYLKWFAGQTQLLRATNPTSFAGISAGQRLDDAIANAIEEVIERDAMMRWWLTAAPGRAVPGFGPPGEIAGEIAAAAAAGYQVRFLDLPARGRIPVVACVCDCTREQRITIGFACRPRRADAAVKAYIEAVGLQESCIDLQSENGILATLGRGRLRPNRLQPLRPDRRYLDSCAPDLSDVTSLFGQLQASLDPRLYQPLRDLSRGRDDLARVSADLPGRTARDYVDRLRPHVAELACADITTGDVARAGYHVVRVVIPGLLPNYATAYPPLGGLPAAQRRAYNRMPLPYA
jgi:ribosomal protein S12 methylthiotransferase accessory factor